MITTIAGATLRSLLARRRAVLMVLLAGVPVLVGLLARLQDPTGDALDRTADVLESLVVATLLPLLALVFGTAALGAELEDGSAIHLLTKPVARWRIVAAKVLAAVPVAAGMAGGATLLTGLLVSGDQGGTGLAVAFTLAVIAGAAVYVVLFVALSILTTRALIVGLAYIVVWEGMLAGLFEGTRILSVRQYVISFATALDPSGTMDASDALALPVAIVGAAVMVAAALVVAIRGLERYEIAAGD
jgi:ABC-2 type transport system permease protein